MPVPMTAMVRPLACNAPWCAAVSMPRAPPLTTVTPKTNKNAFVLVDVGGGVNVTAAMATSSVFTPGNNFANMYNVLSFGGMIYSGDVLGPFPYAMTTCDYNGLKNAVKPMVTGTYQHYMWYFGSNVSRACWSARLSHTTTSRAFH